MLTEVSITLTRACCALFILSLTLTLPGCGFEKDEEGEDESSNAIFLEDETTTLALGRGTGDSFEEGRLELGSDSLSANGSTTVTVNIVNKQDQNRIYTGEAINITFTSVCADSPSALSEFDHGEVTTTTGTTTVTYQASGCEGTDTLYATVDEAQALATLTVAPPELGSLTFVSATPEEIGVQGSGNDDLPNASIVVFKALDGQGNPIANQLVEFALTTTLGAASLSSSEAYTDADGEASTSLIAGAVMGSLRVEATVNTDDGSITTVSTPIAINTGLPDQNSISLSTEFFNPLAWDFDGTIVVITARASDGFNNPVPDSTLISFTTEGGSIEASCQTIDGACEVNWASQNPRPDDGIITILARTTGTATFTDTNSNGIFDVDESFEALPEAFRDDNDNGEYDLGELFFDFNENGLHDDAPTVYQGALCSEAAIALGHCAELVEVRDSLRMIMSGSQAVVTGVPHEITLGDSFTITIHDVNGNTMPVNTTITATTTLGEITKGASTTIPSALNTVGHNITIGTAELEGEINPTGELTITVSVDSFAEQTINVLVNAP